MVERYGDRQVRDHGPALGDRRPGVVRVRVPPGDGADGAQLAAGLPAPIVSIALRGWPADFPRDIAVLRRAPYESRADSVMYRQALAGLAGERGWAVRLYDAKDVETRSRAHPR